MTITETLTTFYQSFHPLPRMNVQDTCITYHSKNPEWLAKEARLLIARLNLPLTVEVRHGAELRLMVVKYSPQISACARVMNLSSVKSKAI